MKYGQVGSCSLLSTRKIPSFPVKDFQMMSQWKIFQVFYCIDYLKWYFPVSQIQRCFLKHECHYHDTETILELSRTYMTKLSQSNLHLCCVRYGAVGVEVCMAL